MSESTREDLQQQVIGVVRKSQEVTLATVKKVVRTLSAATAKLPVDKFEGKLHELPLAARLRELPAPRTVVSSAFDFAGRLLAERRTFAEDLVKATAPLRSRAKGASDASDANDARDTNDAQDAPDAPQAPQDPAA